MNVKEDQLPVATAVPILTTFAAIPAVRSLSLSCSISIITFHTIPHNDSSPSLSLF